MRKFIIISLLLLAAVNVMSAQDEKLSEEKTKIEMFSSKTGTITKFTDFNLPKLKTLYSSVETRIRKINSGNATGFFYQIEKESKYGSKTASIEYSDLLEMIKAIAVLKTAVESDVASNPDYLENKFTTDDGFQIGYYVSKGKSNWYISMDRRGSDNTLFI